MQLLSVASSHAGGAFPVLLKAIRWSQSHPAVVSHLMLPRMRAEPSLQPQLPRGGSQRRAPTIAASQKCSGRWALPGEGVLIRN